MMRTSLILAIVTALLALPFVAWAAVLVNDTFQDGNSQNQALPNSIRIFNGRTATTRTDAVGSVTFQFGSTSSEGFWGFFTDGAPASLDVGDRLTVTTKFSFQGLSATAGTDLRFGLFDSKGTRTTANTTGGINSPTFQDDTGYAARLSGISGGGVPFTIHRRDPAASPTPATDPLSQVTSAGGEYTTLAATSTTPRAPLANNTPYTLNFTVERLSNTENRITVQLTDGGSFNLTSTATDTSSAPHTTFDWFGFRIPSGTNFASHMTFTQWLVQYTPAPPVITVQPQPPNLTVQVGSTVNLSVGASGRDLTYQWRKNGVPITNNPTATTPNLQLTNVQESDSGVYDVVVSNDGGSVESSDVNLTVTTGPVDPPPTITDQPDDTVVVIGNPACLEVTATGNNLTYQWFKNGSPIPGQTGNQLCFASAQLSDAGNYHVVVTNSGGSVLSSTARLIVVSPMAYTIVQPPDDATDVCIDPVLRITFDQPPLPGTSGRIFIHRADGSLYDTIDMSQDTVPTANVPGNQSSRNVGGASINHNYYPIIVTGDTASIYLHQKLEPGTSYYVIIEPGAITDANGAPFVGISDPTVWNFTTRAALAPGLTALTVDDDGSGDFCSVQGAIDYVPIGNTQRVTINVRNGVYTEIIYVRSNKPFITIRGESREGAIIQYANNENLNTGSLGRPTFGVDAPDFTLDNITVNNTTSKLNAAGATRQAEAFRGNNQRIWLNRVNLRSFQDTLQLQSGGSNQGGFVYDSYIEGDVDFTWGGGTVYFKNTELKDVAPASRPNAYYSQIRNINNNGNVYVNCRLTRAPGTPDNSAWLSRIDPDDFPNSQVVWIADQMDSHINPVGWQLDNPSLAPTQANYPNIRFWEYRNTNIGNTALIDTSQRHPISRQISDTEADQWSNPIFVLGGWLPKPVVSLARPNPVGVGETITVNWAAPAGHSTADWVGMYRVGDPDANFLAYKYVGSTATSGQMTFVAPSEGGQYEFRYFLDDSFVRSDTSNPVRVEGSAYSLTAAPTTAQSGEQITVTWNAPAGHSPTDWVGLYEVGDPDTEYITFQYVNSSASSGQLTFTVPSTAGQYEFRYFTNDTFTRVATSNPVTVSGSAYSLTASPSSVPTSAPIQVNWTAPAGHSPQDWVGMYRVGDPDSNYISFQYTGNSNPNGTMVFTSPSEPGQYEFRYFLNDTYTKVATSNPVTVAAGNYSLTASPPAVVAGAQDITVDWNAPAGHSPQDWVGMYRVGDPDTMPITLQYTGNSNPSGTMTFPSTVANGTYEFRYFHNDTYNRAATSNQVTVTGSNHSLVATPPAATPGSTITVNWNAPAGHWATDWVGMYEVGAPDTQFLAFQYTGTTAPSGTMMFTAPAQAGQYEFRYFYNDTFVRAVTSNPVTVAP